MSNSFGGPVALAILLAVSLCPASAGAATERVSIDSAGVQGKGFSGGGRKSVSADGSHVAFSSGASNLVPGDTNGTYDVFVRDRETGKTERVSVDDAGGQGINGWSGAPLISANGRYVAFSSSAPTSSPATLTASGTLSSTTARPRRPSG